MFYAIVANDLSFELPDGRLLINKINFSLGDKLTGLVGPNGVGKTTLAKLIMDKIQPSHGTIKRNVPIGFLSQSEKAKEQAVYEYLLERDYVWSISGERLLENIDSNTKCTHLSGGQWMRVRLSCLPDDLFLILDEPTNDLDQNARELILNFLKTRRGGALIITHDRECLEICNEIFELSNRGLSKYGGNYSHYLEAREIERNNLQDNLKQAKKERDSMFLKKQGQREKQEKRNSKGAALAKRGGIPKILLGARKNQAQKTTAKLEVDALNRANDAVKESFEAYSLLKVDPIMYADLVGEKISSQKLVAEAINFNIKYNDWVYKEDLSFCFRGNIRLAIKGGNGSGKTTLLKALMDEKLEHRGTLKTGNLKTLYIDQKISILDDQKSVIENVRNYTSKSEIEIRNGLAKFLFSNEMVFQKVESLSGGERLRAGLACGLLAQDKPELLILDEPTNNLDLVNIEFLEGLVGQFEGALIVISHDNIFLENCGINEVLDFM